MDEPRPNPFHRLLKDDERWAPSIGIDEGFRRTAQASPAAAAVAQGNLILTYADVDSCADEFAARVLESAVPDLGRPVVLYARRSAALVIAMLGTVRAGRTFAILDSAYPPERLRRQLAMLSPGLVVGIETTAEEIRALLGSETIPSWSYANDELPRHRAPRSAIRNPPNPTAYLLFTSGTTGAPKCIRTSHAPLIHFVDFYRRVFSPGAQDRFSMLSGLSHDPLLRDVFVPLSCGACVVVPGEAIVRSPAELYAWLADAGISFVHTTPQMLGLISNGQGQRPALTRLSHVFSGGDTLRREHAVALQTVAPNASLVNFYGSSETPQAMGFHVVDLDHDATSIPLGRGIDDVQLLVLGQDLQLCEIGAIGQIGIRTHFLSSGYLNDADGTRTKFVASPFSDDPDDRIYLTGDFGYYRPDGAVVCTGREDDQVKIRGYRVELAEVTRAIEGTGLVQNCAVMAHATVAGDNRLVAFVVAHRASASANSQELDSDLRKALQRQLPVPMIPARIVVVDAIPLSPNGKVDRKALAAVIEQERGANGPSLRYDRELSAPLRTLIGTIEDVLEIRVDTLDRSFIDLGGDSLSYVRVCSAVQDALGFSPRDWASRPLRDFSAVLEESDGGGAKPLWAHVEVPLLLRAISIVLVVMTHAGMGSCAATSTLFVVSGASFARFLAPAIRQTGDLGPTLRFVVRFGIPALLWQLLRSVWLGAFWLPNLLLLGTFFQRPGRPLFTLWYLDVLAANVLILAAAVKLNRRLRNASFSILKRVSKFGECLSLVIVGLGVAVAQGQLGWWNGEVGVGSVAPFKWFWMLALGMAIVEARDRPKKLAVSLLIVAVIVFAYVATGDRWLREETCNPFFIVSVGLLAWIPSLPLPRFIQRPVVVIASSTLFIYIVNYTVLHHIMPRVGLPSSSVLDVAVPVLVGIVATRGWDRVQRYAAPAIDHIRATRARKPKHALTPRLR